MVRYLAWIAFGSVLCCTVAAARPPAPEPLTKGTAQPALVGRVLLRDGVVELSLSTIAEGGAAHGVVRGLAGLMADVDTTRHAQHDHPTAGTSADTSHR